MLLPALAPLLLVTGYQQAARGIYWMWGIGLLLIVLPILLLRRPLTWQGLLFLAAGPVALIYVQSFGFYESDWLCRTITGIVFALGTVWLMYPQLEEGFTEFRDP